MPSRTFALAANADFCPITLVLVLLFTAFPSVAQKQPQTDTQHKPDYTVKVSVPLVTLSVTVLTKDGTFVPGLGQENFIVLEDGQPQPIVGLGLIEAPITVVLLLEYTIETFLIQSVALQACYRYVGTLKPDDWAAAITFDKEPHILQDFTQDKDALRQILGRAGLPLLREANLYDALYDTLDRLETVKGRKYLILMASGMDSLSHRIFDQVLKKTQLAKGTVIYSLDTCPGCLDRKAENQMGVFARMTGGKLYLSPCFA